MFGNNTHSLIINFTLIHYENYWIHKNNSLSELVYNYICSSASSHVLLSSLNTLVWLHLKTYRFYRASIIIFPPSDFCFSSCWVWIGSNQPATPHFMVFFYTHKLPLCCLPISPCRGVLLYEVMLVAALKLRRSPEQVDTEQLGFLRWAHEAWT